MLARTTVALLSCFAALLSSKMKKGGMRGLIRDATYL
jgi:hypothetical protein